ncbi:protein of unknown function DUF77 [Desulfofarcimen acetoxidans DSM 771]|uniref:Thiamine-binding protein domain-containing protein n=1 Tax=Desulfofarcimen acetoxidans (strain ATCC 49208 / DSM 771 / KCTC 5769 / VKM B-1644 / 5575) TaxID=485916 RepID=C8W5K0_DESAS|nr:protein of unknown function DUF77 [Desulfofarcimen acetoxidans DSM 771]
MKLAVVEVSIVPLGTGSPGVSAYVARCLEVLCGEKEVVYQLTPMGTIIEGELDAVLSVVRRMHEEPFNSGVERVVTSIRIDDRRDQALTMQGKMASVKNKLDLIDSSK